MLRSLIRDESGIAMGLAVIVVLIVGVMGAGLLVFVRNDLNAVVEVNRGQQAFDAADAGAQAAKRELLSDACPESYDGLEAAEEEEANNSCADSGESDWSFASVEDENDSVGKELTFNNQKVDVRVRYMAPVSEDDPSWEDKTEQECDMSDEDEACYAPEREDNYPENREYFQIESIGHSQNGNARRKIEAIFYTYDLGVPKAYYSPKAITLRGDACISDVSVFSLESIEISGEGSGCEGEDGKITGTDEAYGYWDNDNNSTARSTERAGFASVEGVNVGEEDESGTRDFDGSSSPEFVEDPGDEQSSDEITFPFDHENQDGQSDEDRLQFLKDEAMRQEAETNEDNYRPNSDDITDWPDNADENTVVYIDAIDAGSDESVKWQVGNNSGGNDCSEADAVKGVLVVDGADLEGNGNRMPFSGATIVRDGGFKVGGNICWDGFVDAEEEMTISGTPDPFVSPEVQNRPGFYGVELWSWRELYE